MRIFSAYHHYPYTIPLRVKFFNCFRYPFSFAPLEKFLLKKLQGSNDFFKRLVPPLYFYLKNSWRTVERNGINYTLDISCLIDHSIYFYSLKEPAWENLFIQLKKDFVVLDIGANIGFHTLNFARICNHGKVFAFEPDSDSFSRLKKNIEVNGFTNVMSFNLALGFKTEKQKLFKLYENNPGANRFLNHRPSDHYGVETVDITTCDIINDQLKFSKVDLMKIDVEGFELFVLQGATNLIQKFKPILFVELAEVNLQEHNLKPIDLVSFIQNMGYEIKDAKTMADLDLSNSRIHTDILCFPKV